MIIPQVQSLIVKIEYSISSNGISSSMNEPCVVVVSARDEVAGVDSLKKQLNKIFPLYQALDVESSRLAYTFNREQERDLALAILEIITKLVPLPKEAPEVKEVKPSSSLSIMQFFGGCRTPKKRDVKSVRKTVETPLIKEI
jgi:hypothetical protein